MILIAPEHTDVYRHLAAEEYLLHESDDTILMLWRSRHAVVCGKHQNLCAEVNYGFCNAHNIDTARRLSGGGTVYHDLGNINFTFIQSIPEGLQYAVDYRRFLEPIREALNAFGIETTYSSRNDLLLNGKKISGNAEHVLQKKKRVLHHGTLLFASNTAFLHQALHSTGIYADKAVKSVRSEVTCIQETKPEWSADEFLAQLVQFFEKKPHTNRYVFSEKEEKAIELLRNDKFANPTWYMGYSPAYQVTKDINTSVGKAQITARIHKQLIQDLEITFDDKTAVFTPNFTPYLGQMLSTELCQSIAKELQLIESYPSESQYFLF